MPDEGFEPPTNGLQNRCSTAELIRLYLALFGTLIRSAPGPSTRLAFACVGGADVAFGDRDAPVPGEIRQT